MEPECRWSAASRWARCCACPPAAAAAAGAAKAPWADHGRQRRQPDGRSGAVIIDIRGLHRTFHVGEETVHALAGVDLGIERGELVAITGSSGSGKSTLMNIL